MAKKKPTCDGPEVLVVSMTECDGDPTIMSVPLCDLELYLGDYPEECAVIDGTIIKDFDRKLDMPRIRRRLGLPGKAKECT